MERVSRREFLRRWGKGILGIGLLSLPLPRRRAEAKGFEPRKGFLEPIPSPFFRPLEGKDVECILCPRHCEISPGERGHCEVRENRDGTLYTLAYANPCAVHIDPIEKKPFVQVLPGTRCFSIATAGCNLDCCFCQNWQISQTSPDKTYNYHLPPQEVAELAAAYDCPTIASTYTEPTVFFEYTLAAAKAAKKRGIIYTYHSNGFIEPEPLRELGQYLGAACVDLKGFSEEFYEKMSNASLAPVLRTLKAIHGMGIHLEIVNLVIPTKNDDMGMIREMCLWIKRELSPSVPLHFSRFFPMYRLTKLPPTPVSTLERAREVALEVGLEYVYIGNVPGHEAENTYCPRCKKLLIRRRGFFVLANHLKGGKCPHCGKEIAGIWERPS